MPTPGIEIIDRLSFGTDEPEELRLETIDGSVIIITKHRLTLENFLQYRDNQKASWDLEHGVLGFRWEFLFLVIPHQSMPGAAWIPLAKLATKSPWQIKALQVFVNYSRWLVDRSLPPGEEDT